MSVEPFIAGPELARPGKSSEINRVRCVLPSAALLVRVRLDNHWAKRADGAMGVLIDLRFRTTVPQPFERRLKRGAQAFIALGAGDWIAAQPALNWKK